MNVKRITANILSNGSLESLILVSTSNKCPSQLLPDLLRLKEGRTKQKDLACLSSASTPSWVLAPEEKLVTRDAFRNEDITTEMKEQEQ